MSISLFPHNQKAYEALLDVLEMEHCGCVIHPTGTDKSFIGFKYCEDHPRQRWLNCSWDLMYAEARAFYQENGNLKSSRSYMTTTGNSLNL